MVEDSCDSEVVHITPAPEELRINRNLICPEEHCFASFSNLAHLDMHLTKHHLKQELTPKYKTNEIKLYFCPESQCIYNEFSETRKHFTCLKYLRQHFQKVHTVKSFKCEKCEKCFITEGMKIGHEPNCGKKYECSDCGWSYTSREALLTHARRKGHKIQKEQTKKRGSTPKNVAVNIPIDILVETNKDFQDKATQTNFGGPKKGHTVKQIKKFQSKRKHAENVENTKRSKDETQTSKSFELNPPITTDEKGTSITYDIYKKEMLDEHEGLNGVSYAEDTYRCYDQLVNSSSLCDIETQTDYGAIILDKMIYSNMYTQTCDDSLSELCLNDIQTQTNWTVESSVGCDAIANVQDISDFVSTETQTSFSQCLLNNNSSSTGYPSGITQHTQTCDTLLEGLFGERQSDLIAEFQSTHTQT